MTAVFSAARLTSPVVRIAENLTVLNVFILLALLGGQGINIIGPILQQNAGAQNLHA